MIVDSFMVNSELDMLECRLTEIGDVVDYMVAVEADVDHQDHPKPFHLTENLDRFDRWKDKLVVVQATGLPTAEEFPDPWAREHAQREHVRTACRDLELPPDTVILHGDIDEIPTAVACRNVRPKGFVAMEQRGHFWSLRWRYPTPWCGTVAARLCDIKSFGAMRDTRNITPTRLKNAGWHLSWMPTDGMTSEESAIRKVGSFCHPEATSSITLGLDTGSFLRDGYHVDGSKMIRCEIDRTYPKWVREGNHPDSWAQ